MFRTNRLLVIGALTICTSPLVSQLRLNEVQTRNRSTIEDSDRPGSFPDWIELYNAGDSAMDLGGLFFSDERQSLRKWEVPAGVSVEAGGFLLFWADGDIEQGATHVGFRLDRGGDAVWLSDASGTILDSLVFGELEPDTSFGRVPDGGDRTCVTSLPTPGAAAVNCQSGDPRFSRASGAFVEPFELAITADVPDASIRFTLDGGVPDLDAGSLYTGPISIRRTTRVRARVYEPGRGPGRIVSSTWVALSKGLADRDSNLPLILIDTGGVDIDRLTARPRSFREVLSVFIDTADEDARASVLGVPDYAGHGGLHVRGSSSTQYPKRQYSFEAWDESGEDRDVEMFGMPAESDWILHAPYSDKTLMRNWLMYRWSRRIGRYAARTRFCEVYLHSRGEGAVSSADYRGVYVLMEKIEQGADRVAIERLGPLDDAEPEVTGGYLLKKDWLDGDEFFRTAVYRDALTFVSPRSEEISDRQRDWVQEHFDEFENALRGVGFADPVTGYAQYIDVDSFIDHHLLVELARNVDGFVVSTYLSKDRDGKIRMGPIWDYNGSLGGADYFCSCETEGWHHQFDERDCAGCREGGATFPADNPSAYSWYRRLFEDPTFARRYAVRWAELREVLGDDVLRFDVELAVELLTDGGAADNAVERNFARWPILDEYVWPNFLCCGPYRDHVDWLLEWTTARVAWMDSALTLPPEFSHPGGKVTPGFEVTLTVPPGSDVFLTTNGDDPRAADGSVSAAALRFDGAPLRIEGRLLVRARARTSSGVWSALTEATWFTSLPTLAVTELMYAPPVFADDIISSASAYEFIELKNFGTESVDLNGVRLARAVGDRLVDRFDFAGGRVQQLAAGESLVVARNEEAFRSRYGEELPLAGEYDGTFSNRGDRVIVLGAFDEPLADFVYDDEWYPSTAGEGHSLVLRDETSPRTSWGSAASWQPSVEVGGSPGRVDQPQADGGLLPGDVNRDARLDVADGVALAAFLFLGGPGLPCTRPEARMRLFDSNADQRLNLSDVVHVLRYLFQAGEAPALGLECTSVESCPDVCA